MSMIKWVLIETSYIYDKDAWIHDFITVYNNKPNKERITFVIGDIISEHEIIRLLKTGTSSNSWSDMFWRLKQVKEGHRIK